MRYNRSVKQLDDAWEEAKLADVGDELQKTRALRFGALKSWQKETAQDLLALCIVNGGTFIKFGQVGLPYTIHLLHASRHFVLWSSFLERCKESSPMR